MATTARIINGTTINSINENTQGKGNWSLGRKTPLITPVDMNSILMYLQFRVSVDIIHSRTMN